MSEVVAIIVLALASNAAILWFASSALKAQRQASDDLLALAREALAGGRIIEPPGKAAEEAPDPRRLSIKKWEDERARKEDLALVNDVYFGDERVPPVVETKR
jgi:hypothetical protein